MVSRAFSHLGEASKAEYTSLCGGGGSFLPHFSPCCFFLNQDATVAGEGEERIATLMVSTRRAPGTLTISFRKMIFCHSAGIATTF
jgi:hypothetical protein